jgi:hypothetical protein
MTVDDEEPVRHHTNWRGPRRLNAVYTDEANFDEADEEPPGLPILASPVSISA